MSIKKQKARRAHSVSFQSKPAGQRRALVTGWWKPLFVLTFWERCGTKGVSLEIIQSRTTPFKLLVSSDLALDIPFWIFDGWEKGLKLMWATDVLNRLSPWALHRTLPWGAQLDGAPSTKVFEILDTPSWPCIWEGYVSPEIDELEKNGTNSKVSVSSATSPSSAIWSIPFTTNACILHMACTVLPKCRPWWINGSSAWLSHNDLVPWIWMTGLRTYSVFLFVSLRALTGVLLLPMDRELLSDIEETRDGGAH